MDSKSLSIVPVGLSGIPLIQRIAGIAFPATYKGIVSDEQIVSMMGWMYSTESLTKQMTDEKNQFFLASWNDEPIGFVSVRPDSPAVYHLEKLYVLPASQGTGVGGRLFRKACEQARSWQNGPCAVQLNVNKNNKAVQFYLHMGMQKIKDVVEPISDGFVKDDYIMEILVK
ncbi:MAG: GNAT family N-acetyltransferase [Paludibacteraceae bacterium]|nr:GNAT family N-acetyltransferase [Candidatus Physcocola equi]MCQ2233147.1 GNAT family N-acetyltransferase [Paludibacteraceae bacterium]